MKMYSTLVDSGRR